MIVETSANKLYAVFPAYGYDHCWFGYPVKLKRASGAYILTAAGERLKAAGKPELVRKAGCRKVEG